MKWQPIETAPKDGTDVLVCQPKTHEQLVAFFNKDGLWQFAQNVYLRNEPSHWMPLQPPPEE